VRHAFTKGERTKGKQQAGQEKQSAVRVRLPFLLAAPDGLLLKDIGSILWD
jgi:hypothetical protein